LILYSSTNYLATLESIQSLSPYINTIGILILMILSYKGFLAQDPGLNKVFNAYSLDAGLRNICWK